jgi:hypothetical protein
MVTGRVGAGAAPAVAASAAASGVAGAASGAVPRASGMVLGWSSAPVGRFGVWPSATAVRAW